MAPGRAAPIAPRADADGCGAWCWDRNVTPTAVIPTRMSRTPATPASWARRLTGLGGRLYPSSGHEATTRNPAMRGHLASPNAASLRGCPTN